MCWLLSENLAHELNMSDIAQSKSVSFSDNSNSDCTGLRLTITGQIECRIPSKNGLELYGLLNAESPLG